MDIEQIRDYCLQKPGATEDQAFGPDGLLFRVNGKIFAYLNLERPDCVTLKCQPDHAIALRDRYNGVSGAWHWNKRHWNDVRLDADVPDDVILSLVDHSYEEVVRGLPKKTLFRFTEMPSGWWHTHLPTTDSLMNDLQRPPYADHPIKVVLLTTDHQQAGRGQRGTTWESEERKNLLFGLRFRPKNLKAEHSFRISQAVALAVADAVAECVKGCPVSIKWPNDIYCGDRKVCGMLLEHDLCGTEITATRVGIGINVNQETFTGDAPNPVSLLQIRGRETDRAALLRKFVKHFVHHCEALRQNDFASLQTRYLHRLYRKGIPALFTDAQGTFTATIQGVDAGGRLLLRDDKQHERSYTFKEVSYVI